MNDKQHKLGVAGERLVYDYLGKVYGKDNVHFSEDWYDDEKDIIVFEGNRQLHVEVKTQTPFYKYDAFTLKPSQWNKIDNSDMTYFVKVPDVHDDCVRIYENTNRYNLYESNYGPMRLYPIEEMLEVFAFKSPEIVKYMRDNRVSEFPRY